MLSWGASRASCLNSDDRKASLVGFLDQYGRLRIRIFKVIFYAKSLEVFESFARIQKFRPQKRIGMQIHVAPLLRLRLVTNYLRVAQQLHYFFVASSQNLTSPNKTSGAFQFLGVPRGDFIGCLSCKSHTCA